MLLEMKKKIPKLINIARKEKKHSPAKWKCAKQ